MDEIEKKAKDAKRKREAYHKDGGAKEYDRRRKLSIRYSKAKYDAGRRKSGAKPFTITLEEYLEILSKPCEYCRKPLINETGSGIDRIDNALGYEPNNCNPCCRDCNIRRNTSMPADIFKEQTRLNGYIRDWCQVCASERIFSKCPKCDPKT